MTWLRAKRRWGIGPVFGSLTAGYMLLAAALTHRFPDLLHIQQLSRERLYCAALVLGCPGLALYAWSLSRLNRALRSECLATSGPYAIVRHPIYAAWIMLILPAVALALRSWALLATPAVAYGLFRILVAREDERLEKRFGTAYYEYREQVPELFPAWPDQARKPRKERKAKQP